MTDVHTHNLAAGPDAIINIEPDTQLLAAGRFSTGVHPWRSTEAAALWPLVEALAADPRITAIGGGGLAGPKCRPRQSCSYAMRCSPKG